MGSKVQRNALASGCHLLWHRIDSILGQGGFGITYLATDTNLDRKFAIKEYLPLELAVRESDALAVQYSATERQSAAKLTKAFSLKYKHKR